MSLMHNDSQTTLFDMLQTSGCVSVMIGIIALIKIIVDIIPTMLIISGRNAFHSTNPLRSTEELVSLLKDRNVFMHITISNLDRIYLTDNESYSYGLMHDIYKLSLSDKIHQTILVN